MIGCKLGRKCNEMLFGYTANIMRGEYTLS